MSNEVEVKESCDENTTPPKTSLISKIIKIVLPLVLGVTIIYFLVRDIDPKELWEVLKGANWGILSFALIFGLLGNTIRGYRWRVIIRPLGYQPKVWNLIFAIYGGYAVNFILPRAGELWRCGVVAKDEKIPFTKLFGTMIIDRLTDTMTVLLISCFAFLFNMQFFINQLKGNAEAFNSMLDVLKSPILYTIIILIVGGTYIIFRFFGNNPLIAKIKGFFKTIVHDVKAIWNMNQKGKFLLFTVGIWTSYFLYFYTTFYAFDFTRDLGFTAGLIAFALSSISMGIPSNGGLGPWHVAVIAALMLYGVDELNAKVFATGVFTMQSAWVILCGLFGIVALSVKNRKVK